jgi:hypothetical protein
MALGEENFIKQKKKKWSGHCGPTNRPTVPSAAATFTTGRRRRLHHSPPPPWLPPTPPPPRRPPTVVAATTRHRRHHMQPPPPPRHHHQSRRPPPLRRPPPVEETERKGVGPGRRSRARRREEKVRPPNPLPGEEEVVHAADLPAAEDAPTGSSVVAVPAGSAAERSPDPPPWPRPPDLLAGGRARCTSRLGLPPHLAPPPLLSA